MAETASGGEEAERRKRKRKRREKEKKEAESDDRAAEAEELTDPLVVLGSDLVMKVLEFLDARSVARLLVVSRGWHHLAASDRLWAPRVP